MNVVLREGLEFLRSRDFSVPSLPMVYLCVQSRNDVREVVCDVRGFS